MTHYTAEEGKVYDKLVFPNGDKYAQYFPLEGDVGTSYYYRAKRVDFSENEDEPDKISLTYIKFLLDGGRIKSSSVNADLPKYEAFEGVQTKANNSLQKPEIAPAKTMLVGVGAQGQENIEIGDNLTLANGKLSAMGGVNGLESDAEGNLTVGKDLKVDGKLKLKEIANDFNHEETLLKKGFIHDSGDIPLGTSNLMLSYAGRMFNNDHAYWGPILSGGPYSDKVSAICATDSFANQYDLSKRLYYHFIKLTSTNGVVIFSFEHQSKNPINTMAKLIKYLNTIHVCANGKIGESAVLGVGVENKKLVAITADSTIDLTEYTMTDTVGTRGDM